MPMTNRPSITDLARDMYDSYTIAADAARVGDDAAAQSNYDEGQITEALILSRLGELTA